jgi:hypothetical protein
MNKKIKFHKATGPAFNRGEVWVSSSGVQVEIISVRKFLGATSGETSDYAVLYKTDPLKNPCSFHERDAWNFQVSYTHKADTYAK